MITKCCLIFHLFYTSLLTFTRRQCYKMQIIVSRQIYRLQEVNQLEK